MLATLYETKSERQSMRKMVDRACDKNLVDWATCKGWYDQLNIDEQNMSAIRYAINKGGDKK
ncbi:MAG: hypothetical protein AAGA80_28100 [Cyanobacteria bacterium P01_F01_bin.143]